MARFSKQMIVVSLFVAAALSILASCSTAFAQAPPTYKVDASWPKELPNN